MSNVWQDLSPMEQHLNSEPNLASRCCQCCYTLFSDACNGCARSQGSYEIDKLPISRDTDIDMDTAGTGAKCRRRTKASQRGYQESLREANYNTHVDSAPGQLPELMPTSSPDFKQCLTIPWMDRLYIPFSSAPFAATPRHAIGSCFITRSELGECAIQRRD